MDAQKALEGLMEGLGPFGMEDYIYKYREGVNNPITRQQALNVLKDAVKAVGVKENVGTHTLRKTWDYHAWKNGFGR